MSFWVSMSGSDQPYALRNKAIAASKLLTPRTTCSMPLTGAPCTLAEVWTRQARGVWSSMMNGSVEPGVPEPTAAVIHSIDMPSGRLRLPRSGALTGIPAFFRRSTSCSKTFVPTAHAQVTASSAINFAQSEPAVAPGFTGAINSMYDASSKPMMAIWVMPLPWGPPRSGVMPTSVKAWRSVSRFDPQIDAWSSSSVVLLVSWAMAGWEISKRTRVARDKLPQIGELRLDMRASLERGMVRQNARSGNDFLAIRSYPGEWHRVFLEMWI